MITGGPAFPTQNYQTLAPIPTGYSEGITTRDYFAAKAMQAHMRMAIEGLSKTPGADSNSVNQTIAAWSYRMADAMLSQREKS